MRHVLACAAAAALALGLAATGARSGEPPAAGGSEVMTRERLEAMIEELAEEFEGQPGWIRFVYDGVPMACVSDIAADRMRITSPVAPVSDIQPEQLLIAMEANFHSALDARYATSQGVVHAVYVHPLSPLTEEQVLSAVYQVASARKTFGTTYTSGAFTFGGGR